jgi:membrane-bound lytic murein transglycosylase A
MRLAIRPFHHNRAAWTLTAAAAVLAVIAASCSTPRGWVPVKAPEALAWSDDGDREPLLAALEHSKAYYRRVPPGTPFRFGTETYSAAELIAALTRFGQLVESHPDPVAFRAALLAGFRVYESIAESGENLFTGYYEPVIPGSETPMGHLTAPLYSRPADLVEVPLDLFDKSLPPRRLMGRVENGTVVPYYSRSEIQSRDAVKGMARPIVYVDPVDLFFLQIQGSGRVQLNDGRMLRVGYDGANGHPYRSLGAEMIRRELLKREEVSLQSIRAYLAQHPEAVPALLNTNPSYVFFRALDEGDGPLGNLGVPLTPGRSLAADQRRLPPGAIAYVETEVPVSGDTKGTRPLRRFVLVQDTGGAIRGHGRGDIFWGTGAEAEWRAGHAKHTGRLLILVPKKEWLAQQENAPVAP